MSFYKHVEVNMIFLLIILCFLGKNIFSQPYIYRSENSDSISTRYSPWAIKKFDLQSKQWTTCLDSAVFNSFNIDNKDEWLVVDQGLDNAEAFNLKYPSQYIVLPFSQQQIGKILNSQNRLYVFAKNLSTNRANLHIVNLLSSTEETTYNYMALSDENEDAFFSRNDSLIYFTKDTVYDDVGVEKTKLLTYSVASNSIISEQYLYELEYQGAKTNQLCFGSDGLGIIGSYSGDTADKNSYYRLHDFNNNTNSAFIHENGYADPFFTNNGKYMVLVETSLERYDSTDEFEEYKTGKISIYESSSGNLLRVLSLPPYGETKFSELYPDELYYACDLDSIPRVFCIKPDSLLASTRVESISPAIVFANTGNFTLEVTGKGFTSASKVLWNDSVRTTTFVSDSLLRATILAADVATVGDRIVRVQYDSASSALSDSMVFSVVNTLPKPVRLVIEKEIDNHNGTMTAWFGYLNVNDRSVYIPVGDKNSFSPTPIDRGQATIFLPGRHKYAFGVTFPNTINIEWQLNGRRAKAGSVCEN